MLAIIIAILLILAIFEFSNGQFCGQQNVAANFGTGSNVPQQLCVPTLAFNQSTIWLVWNKPDNHSAIRDYNVYMNGKKLCSASKNAIKYSSAAPYIANFYAQDSATKFHVPTAFHSFLVTNLAPNSTYNFTVRSVDFDGAESADTATLVATTAPEYSKVVDVTQFGAVGDNSTVNTVAIQQAINNCSNGSKSAFGCKVIIPEGIFLTGPIILKSNMTFEVTEGATLKATTNSSDFNASDGTILSLIATNGTSQNIRLTGKGTLDGSGWKLAETIVDELGRQLPVYAKGNVDTVAQLGLLAANQVAAAGGGYSSRSTLATFSKVTNLYFGDVKVVNPSKDTIKVSSNSENIVLANTFLETYNANNGDGIGISSSQKFIAFNNFFNTGDDCIATNSGQGAAGQASRKPVQYLWIFNNYFREGHGAFVVGSQTSAWMQDILVEDNVLFRTDNGLRLKSTPATGGGARRIVFRDSAMLGVGVMQGNVTLGGREFQINQTDLGGQYTQSPFIFTLAYTAGNSAFVAANQSAQFRDINVTRISVDNGKPGQGGSFIAVDGYDGSDSNLGFPQTFHQNLTFTNIKFTNVAPANISRLADSTFINVTITNWGNSSSPWMIRNSQNLTFINVIPKPDGF